MIDEDDVVRWLSEHRDAAWLLLRCLIEVVSRLRPRCDGRTAHEVPKPAERIPSAKQKIAAPKKRKKKPARPAVAEQLTLFP